MKNNEQTITTLEQYVNSLKETDLYELRRITDSLIEAAEKNTFKTIMRFLRDNPTESYTAEELKEKFNWYNTAAALAAKLNRSIVPVTKTIKRVPVEWVYKDCNGTIHPDKTVIRFVDRAFYSFQTTTTFHYWWEREEAIESVS